MWLDFFVAFLQRDVCVCVSYRQSRAGPSSGDRLPLLLCSTPLDSLEVVEGCREVVHEPLPLDLLLPLDIKEHTQVGEQVNPLKTHLASLPWRKPGCSPRLNICLFLTAALFRRLQIICPHPTISQHPPLSQHLLHCIINLLCALPLCPICPLHLLLVLGDMTTDIVGTI